MSKKLTEGIIQGVQKSVDSQVKDKKIKIDWKYLADYHRKMARELKDLRSKSEYLKFISNDLKIDPYCVKYKLF